MSRWLFWRNDDGQDEEISKAEEQKKKAEEDYKEAMGLIRLLEIEREKNHYADLIESALGHKRKST